jgi:hypothetical protein
MDLSHSITAALVIPSSIDLVTRLVHLSSGHPTKGRPRPWRSLPRGARG